MLLGAQRASLDSDELHAGAPLQPRRNTALTKQRNGNQKELIGSGSGCKDAVSAAHEPKM
jgi:hypothetical protein